MLCTLLDESAPAPLMPWSSAEFFPLAAEGQVNAEKPHQGVTGKNAGLHQRSTACNSTTALGVSWRQWSGTVPGATVSYEYDGFGNSVSTSGNTPNEFLYRGEQYDSDLSLYYLRARYYNPLTGRFLSRDPNDPMLRDSNGMPVDPRTLHKYLYAGGDPVNAKDPTGRSDVNDTAQVDLALLGYIQKVAATATLEERLYFCTGLTILYMYNNPGATTVDTLWFYEYCVARVNGGFQF